MLFLSLVKVILLSQEAELEVSLYGQGPGM